MKDILISLLLVSASSLALGQTTVNFDDVAPGRLPPDWIAGVTGSGSPKWLVEEEVTAPSKAKVLKQSGVGDYPWCIKKDTLLKDGFVEVKFKPLTGKEDQAGGIVWRWQDGDNYYITRANALEDNITIYRTVGGYRSAFKSMNTKVSPNTWHKMRVDFAGNKFKVTFDNKVAIEASDDTFKEAGSIGVWTKADSVTSFDDFTYGSLPSL